MTKAPKGRQIGWRVTPIDLPPFQGWGTLARYVTQG
jgi:hypothetical protein